MKVWLAAALAVLVAATVSVLGAHSGGFAAPASQLVSGKAVEKTNFYHVSGTTLDELRDQVFTRGPYDRGKGLRFAGWTEWRIKWWFDQKDTPQGCAVDKAATEVHVSYTLPRWTDEDRASPEVRQAWKRFIDALTLHEEGHGQLARELGDRLRFAMESLPPEPDCDQLDDRVNELANRMIMEDKEQEEYDRRTGHGQTQGAAFPSIMVHAASPSATQ